MTRNMFGVPEQRAKHGVVILTTSCSWPGNRPRTNEANHALSAREAVVHGLVVVAVSRSALALRWTSSTHSSPSGFN